MPVCCAFDLRIQNYGLAARLLSRARKSIIEDVRMRGASTVRAVCGSIKAINEGYRRRNGFRTVRELTFQKETWGSERDIVSLEMVRNCLVNLNIEYVLVNGVGISLY